MNIYKYPLETKSYHYIENTAAVQVQSVRCAVIIL